MHICFDNRNKETIVYLHENNLKHLYLQIASHIFDILVTL